MCPWVPGAAWKGRGTVDIDRRGFILATLTAALAPIAIGAAGKWTRTATAAAPMLRPDPLRSASSQICAHCGLPGHASLDPACPVSGATGAALQSAARQGAGSARGTDV
jgi:hypothetical protein